MKSQLAKFVCFASISSLLTLGCSSLAQFTLAQGRAVGTVAQGTLLVKRSGASAYGPLSSGTLFAGDLVKVENGSSAAIRCLANNITYTLPDDGIPQGVADICP